MQNHRSFGSSLSFSRTLTAAAGLALGCSAASAGTWTKIVNNPPGAVNLMLLLSDGTVMCANNNGSTIGKAWYKLTPNASGSYVNGTWSSLASMHDTRLYYQTQLLQDGRVYCSGGEYGTGGPKAEIYSPNTNVWTTIAPPAALWNPASDNFYDGNSEILPDGSVMIMPVFPHTSAIPLIYHPVGNSWSNAGKLFRGTWQDEASWAKLPDDSLLTIDPFGTNSERYIPSQNKWVNDGVVPVSLYDPFGFELGGAHLLPNGKVFFLGSTGHTAIYTPTGNTSPGTWIAGPDIPGSHGTPDAPSAMMINGKILCAVSAIPTSGNHFPSPTSFYEYDYVSNSFASITGPTGATDPISSYQAMMLQLPTGQVMYSHMGTDVYVYTPTGSAVSLAKPIISQITSNGNGTFHLEGIRLNGISQGAVYGDDWQMSTNFPLVRLNHSNGNTYYGRTFGWSSTGVMKINDTVSTEYSLPSGFPSGRYTLQVVTNGVASDAATEPTITGNPSSVDVCKPNSLIVLHVTVTGTQDLNYQWRKGSVPIINGGHYSGATTSSLIISPVTSADEGSNYNCVVTNALGSDTSRNAAVTYCPADFDCSGFVDTDDFTAFVTAFELGANSADFDGTGFVDTDDFTAFVLAFEQGC